MKIRKFNENSNQTEYIQIVEDIMFDLKDEFGDKLEINVGPIGPDILLNIKSANTLYEKEAIEMFNLVTKFQSMLVESLERIEEAIDAKVEIDNRFNFTFNSSHNCSVTWPEFFRIKIN